MLFMFSFLSIFLYTDALQLYNLPFEHCGSTFIENEESLSIPLMDKGSILFMDCDIEFSDQKEKLVYTINNNSTDFDFDIALWSGDKLKQTSQPINGRSLFIDNKFTSPLMVVLKPYIGKFKMDTRLGLLYPFKRRSYFPNGFYKEELKQHNRGIEIVLYDPFRNFRISCPLIIGTSEGLEIVKSQRSKEAVCRLI